MRKEIGSFYPSVNVKTSNEKWCDSANLAYTGSGRDALYAILWEINNRSEGQVKRIWLPSYYCHSVTHILKQRFKISIYEARPKFAAEIEESLTKNDVLVFLEYFGHKSNIKFSGEPVVVLDKTHNPTSDFKYEFHVDFSFGSLRKMLPVVDGGFYFNGNGGTSRKDWAVTGDHAGSFDAIRASMKLKLEYLEGGRSDKESYISLHASGESNIGGNLTPSGMLSEKKLMDYADFNFYLNSRQRNNKHLKELINSESLSLCVIDDDLFFTIKFESELSRESIRKKLIHNDIYPVILWPVDSDYMNAADQDLSKRTLVLPTDFRYDESDMAYMADILEKELS